MRAKNVGKKSSQNSAKTRFLYSHEYRDQEMGGKKRVKQFFQKHTNSAIKEVKEKNRHKSAKTLFLYSHEFRDQKMEEKKRGTIFP